MKQNIRNYLNKRAAFQRALIKVAQQNQDLNKDLKQPSAAPSTKAPISTPAPKAVNLDITKPRVKKTKQQIQAQIGLAQRRRNIQALKQWDKKQQQWQSAGGGYVPYTHDSEMAAMGNFYGSIWDSLKGNHQVAAIQRREANDIAAKHATTVQNINKKFRAPLDIALAFVGGIPSLRTAYTVGKGAVNIGTQVATGAGRGLLNAATKIPIFGKGLNAAKQVIGTAWQQHKAFKNAYIQQFGKAAYRKMMAKKIGWQAFKYLGQQTAEGMLANTPQAILTYAYRDLPAQQRQKALTGARHFNTTGRAVWSAGQVLRNYKRGGIGGLLGGLALQGIFTGLNYLGNQNPRYSEAQVLADINKGAFVDSQRHRQLANPMSIIFRDFSSALDPLGLVQISNNPLAKRYKQLVNLATKQQQIKKQLGKKDLSEDKRNVLSEQLKNIQSKVTTLQKQWVHRGAQQVYQRRNSLNPLAHGLNLFGYAGALSNRAQDTLVGISPELAGKVFGSATVRRGINNSVTGFSAIGNAENAQHQRQLIMKQYLQNMMSGNMAEASKYIKDRDVKSGTDALNNWSFKDLADASRGKVAYDREIQGITPSQAYKNYQEASSNIVPRVATHVDPIMAQKARKSKDVMADASYAMQISKNMGGMGAGGQTEKVFRSRVNEQVAKDAFNNGPKAFGLYLQSMGMPPTLARMIGTKAGMFGSLAALIAAVPLLGMFFNGLGGNSGQQPSVRPQMSQSVQLYNQSM